ncbi:hypothetical protein Trydic_g17439 [Trypoxylus dichotomus]
MSSERFLVPSSSPHPPEFAPAHQGGAAATSGGINSRAPTGFSHINWTGVSSGVSPAKGALPPLPFLFSNAVDATARSHPLKISTLFEIYRYKVSFRKQ